MKSFHLKQFHTNKTKKEIKNLDIKKASQQKDIPKKPSKQKTLKF